MDDHVLWWCSMMLWWDDDHVLIKKLIDSIKNLWTTYKKTYKTYKNSIKSSIIIMKILNIIKVYKSYKNSIKPSNHLIKIIKTVPFYPFSGFWRATARPLTFPPIRNATAKNRWARTYIFIKIYIVLCYTYADRCKRVNFAVNRRTLDKSISIILIIRFFSFI